MTDELKKKLAPVNSRLREIERERAERRKVRKRVKMVKKEKEDDVEMTSVSAPAAAAASNAMEIIPTATAGDGSSTAPVVPGDLPDEKEAREKEVAELKALVDPTLKEDLGANVTGMYELCGEWVECPPWLIGASDEDIWSKAIVTHKGASADGGHYIAWVRKDEIQPTTGPDAYDNASDEWFKFDDDKVRATDVLDRFD